MTDLNPMKSITTFNVTGLNTPTKAEVIRLDFKKARPNYMRPTRSTL